MMTYKHTLPKSLKIILKTDVVGERGGEKTIQDTNPKRLFCSSQKKFSYCSKLPEITRSLYLVQDKNFRSVYLGSEKQLLQSCGSKTTKYKMLEWHT